jgi:hypothetical protein
MNYVAVNHTASQHQDACALAHMPTPELDAGSVPCGFGTRRELRAQLIATHKSEQGTIRPQCTERNAGSQQACSPMVTHMQPNDH